MGNLQAKCIKNIDPWGDVLKKELEIGMVYDVEELYMSSSYTNITLKGINGCYNSILFEFYLDGVPHDIYTDKNYNPYI